MELRPLGETGLTTSALALGTVALGVDYGIRAPGQFGVPDAAEARNLLCRAADAGVRLFDTAPNYGCAEQRLGEALGAREECLLATKINHPRDPSGQWLSGRALSEFVEHSVDQSLQNLRRERIDILQIHNASVELLARDDFIDALLREQARGRVGVLGASVYREEEMMAVVTSPLSGMLQAGFSLLDQRLRSRALPALAEAGGAFVARSVWLKGALTEKSRFLPDDLSALREAARRVVEGFGIDWSGLPRLALRFCLGEPGVSAVLVGPRTTRELEVALEALDDGPLSPAEQALAHQLALNDPWLLNPANWSVA